MGVSKNRGIPKSWILIGLSIINHPLWGTPIFGNLQYQKTSKHLRIRNTTICQCSDQIGMTAMIVVFPLALHERCVGSFPTRCVKRNWEDSHQTFRWYLNGGTVHLYKLYGYGLCKGIPIPNTAGYKETRKPSILGTNEMFGETTTLLSRVCLGLSPCGCVRLVITRIVISSGSGDPEENLHFPLESWEDHPMTWIRGW